MSIQLHHSASPISQAHLDGGCKVHGFPWGRSEGQGSCNSKLTEFQQALWIACNSFIAASYLSLTVLNCFESFVQSFSSPWEHVEDRFQGFLTLLQLGVTTIDDVTQLHHLCSIPVETSSLCIFLSFKRHLHPRPQVVHGKLCFEVSNLQIPPSPRAFQQSTARRAMFKELRKYRRSMPEKSVPSSQSAYLATQEKPKESNWCQTSPLGRTECRQWGQGEKRTWRQSLQKDLSKFDQVISLESGVFHVFYFTFICSCQLSFDVCIFRSQDSVNCSK